MLAEHIEKRSIINLIRSEPHGSDIIMNNQHISRGKIADSPLKQRLLNRYKEYLQLAQEKSSKGDRIGAENDYQHAEHFFRSAAEQKDTSR